jgi:hypothetical protein
VLPGRRQIISGSKFANPDLIRAGGFTNWAIRSLQTTSGDGITPANKGVIQLGKALRAY